MNNPVDPTQTLSELSPEDSALFDQLLGLGAGAPRTPFVCVSNETPNPQPKKHNPNTTRKPLLSLISNTKNLVSNQGLPLIELHDFYLKIGTNTLFKEAQYTIRTQEWSWIQSPNGSGKSSLMKLLAHWSPWPDASKVSYHLKPQEIVFQPQQPHWIEALSVRENLQLCWGRSFQDQLMAFQDWLPEHFLATRPNMLSGGERALLTWIRTLGTDAKLYLADEPFAAMDEQTNAQAFTALLHRNQLPNATPFALWISAHQQQPPVGLSFQRLSIEHGTIVVKATSD